MRAAFLAVILAGCATTVPDDSEAVDAPPQAIGKADSAAFLGLYASHATHHSNGDVPDLELRSDGQFVRARCYRASCSLDVPEFGAFDQYTSSTGHTYVRFYSAYDASKVADVYEIRAFTKGVQLRKAYSTRWQSLYTTVANTNPMCAPNQVYVAGAGGCIATPGQSETNCDASKGMWTDDDSTLIQSYCICDVGQYLAATGACSQI